MTTEELLKDLEDKRNKGLLTDDHLSEFNKTGALKINPSAIDEKGNSANYNMDQLNKTGENYKDTAFKTADTLSEIASKEAKDKTDIEVAKNKVKTSRSDETRKELLKETGDFKDKQEARYEQVKGITDRQERIANREANIAEAKAGRYGDIYSDGAMANIRNDIISKYGKNILNAEQYALNTNRTIDNDLLNVGLKELEDKDKRDAFKNLLLDKENSYLLNAISEAANGNKKAVKDVETFYQTYTKQKAGEEFTRSSNTERRDAFEKEFASASQTRKGDILRDMSYQIKGFGLIADRIPKLIESYPGLGLSELKGKVNKIAELALTGKQRLDPILAKDEKDRTAKEKQLLDWYIQRGYEEGTRSDRTKEDTSGLAAKNTGLGESKKVAEIAKANEVKKDYNKDETVSRDDRDKQVNENKNKVSNASKENNRIEEAKRQADDKKRRENRNKIIRAKRDYLKSYGSKINKLPYVNGKYNGKTKSQYISDLKKLANKKFKY